MRGDGAPSKSRSNGETYFGVGDQSGGTASQPNIPSGADFLVVGVVSGNGCDVMPLSLVKTTLAFCVVEASLEDASTNR